LKQKRWKVLELKDKGAKQNHDYHFWHVKMWVLVSSLVFNKRCKCS
jgi:hypothetical protein